MKLILTVNFGDFIARWELKSIFKIGLNNGTINLRTLLFCVMLVVTAIPLAAHIYSIERYSDFITNSDYENKRDLFGKILASTVQGKHRSNVLLVGSLVTEFDGFIECLKAHDIAGINQYLETVRSEPFFEKSDVQIEGLKVYDENNDLVGEWDTSSLDESAVQNFLQNRNDLTGPENFGDAFDINANGVPTYMMVIPVEGTAGKHKLVVIASVWESLNGIANIIRADFEMRGMNDELLFREEYQSQDESVSSKQNESNLKKIGQRIPVGDNGGFVTMIAYVDDQLLDSETDSLKFTAIVVALLCLIIVWVMGTYLLKVNFLRRIELFSQALKNIVDGKPAENLPASTNDEFDVLAKQLQRVIDHNTERTRIKEKLESAIEQAEVASVAKSDFLANMSHELRTPLNAIIGFSEILANESMADYSKKRTQEYATDIMQSGRHLLSIINDILDLSKVEAGKMRFYEDEVDLIEICEAAMRVLHNQADEKNIDISLEANDDFPLIKADERMMQQILTNLLSNAVKFSLDGGDIEIAIKMTPENVIQVSVTDNGIGIAQNKLQDIMEPFHQVETSYAKTEVGTGLGLSLVKAFVEIHDGNVQIESELGKRTTVYVFLPGSRVVSPGEDAFCSLDYKSAITV